MRRTLALVVLVSASALASAAPGRRDAPERCRQLRLLPDGREVSGEAAMGATGSRGNRAEAGSDKSGSWSAARVRSRPGSSRASVSSSSSASSSSAGGRGTSRSVSSYTDEDGRTVTTTHDERGCTIVVDERETKGE